MMPQTVPNSPTKGDVAPMVASRPMPSRIRRASARTISAKLEAARSLMPASLGYARRQPRLAHRRRQEATPARCPWRPARIALPPAIARRRSWRAPSAACAAPRDNSIILAMKMVQVTSEAKARPIMTALTRMSADRNIDHGDSSCSSAVAAFSNFSRSVSRSIRSAAAQRSPRGCGCLSWLRAAGRARRGSGLAERRRLLRPAGDCVVCWADDGAASDSIASAESTADVHRARQRHVLHTSAQ